MRHRAVIQDKPASLTDRCTNGNAQDVPMASCQAVVQSFGTPRFDAGEPHSDDILKCQLRPLPSGVCDYSKPGMARGRPRRG